MLLTFFALALLIQVNATQMQVIVTNTPGYYYSHRCDLSFTFISSKFFSFDRSSRQLFMFTILESTEETRFLNYYVPTYVQRNDSTRTIQTLVDNCKRGVATNKFYCAQITSNIVMWPQLKLPYNETHGMYKFSIYNLVCPRANKGTGNQSYHIKFKIEVARNKFQPGIQIQKIVTYKFKGLKYRIVSSISVNKVYNADGLPFLNNDTQVQARHYLINSSSLFEVSMFIPNSTQKNSWQILQIQFLQPPNSVIFTQNCSLEVSYQNMQTLAYQKINEVKIQCKFSPLTNILTFFNKNFTSQNFVFNQAFNRYQLFQQPSIRFRFQIEIKFNQQAQVQFVYRVSATTSFEMDDSGKLANISTTNAVIYENSDSPQTIYGVNLSEYEQLDPRYRVPVLLVSENISSSSSPVGFIEQLFNRYFKVSQLPLIVVASILLIAMLLFCIRKELWKCEKYLFLVFTLSDLFVKVTIVLVIDGLADSDMLRFNNKQVSFMLKVFLVVQYGGLGVILFFTYWLYMIAAQKNYKKKVANVQQTQNQISQTQSKSQSTKPNKSIVLILLAMLLNYKFYCICLFDIKIGKDLKPRRFRNDQLYVKFCWHLVIEVILILVQIFCLLVSCTYVPISVFFAVHQGFFALLMAIVGKTVLQMLKIKKMKNKLREICQLTKNEEGKIKDGEAERGDKEGDLLKQNSQLNKELEIYSKKSEKLEKNENENDEQTDRKF